MRKVVAVEHQARRFHLLKTMMSKAAGLTNCELITDAPKSPDFAVDWKDVRISRKDKHT